MPDRLVIRSCGEVDFVELKRPSGRLSGPQKAMLKRLKEVNAKTHVVWSKEEARELIRRWEEKE